MATQESNGRTLGIFCLLGQHTTPELYRRLLPHLPESIGVILGSLNENEEAGGVYAGRMAGICHAAVFAFPVDFKRNAQAAVDTIRPHVAPEHWGKIWIRFGKSPEYWKDDAKSDRYYKRLATDLLAVAYGRLPRKKTIITFRQLVDKVEERKTSRISLAKLAARFIPQLHKDTD